MCTVCHDRLEDIEDILCPVYTSIKTVLFEIATEVCNGFPNSTVANKLIFIFFQFCRNSAFKY